MLSPDFLLTIEQASLHETPVSDTSMHACTETNASLKQICCSGNNFWVVPTLVLNNTPWLLMLNNAGCYCYHIVIATPTYYGC